MTRNIYAIIAAFLLALAVPVGAYADPGIESTRSLEAFFADIPADLRARIISDLTETGEHTRFFSGEASLELLPDLPVKEEIRDDIRELEPRIGMEALFLLPSSDPSASMDEKVLRIYNTMLSVSTMQGIDYYSASRERYRLLFERSHFILSPENTKRIPDPRMSRIPEHLEMTVLQEDLTFGENIYGISYTARGGAVLATMENLTVMKYGIFPVLRAHNLHLYLIAVPLEDHVLFYGGFGARVPAIPFLEKKAQTSLYNRIVALYRWFEGRLAAG